jgi:hypothetical protein
LNSYVPPSSGSKPFPPGDELLAGISEEQQHQLAAVLAAAGVVMTCVIAAAVDGDAPPALLAQKILGAGASRSRIRSQTSSWRYFSLQSECFYQVAANGKAGRKPKIARRRASNVCTPRRDAAT